MVDVIRQELIMQTKCLYLIPFQPLPKRKELEKKSITLSEAITLRLISSDGFIRLDPGKPSMTLSEAISSGRLDAENSWLRDPTSGRYLTLREAISIGLLDPMLGQVRFEGQWITLADARCRGIFALEDETVPMMPFDDAMLRGLIDGSRNVARHPNTGEATTIEEAFKRGWLARPPTESSIQMTNVSRRGESSVVSTIGRWENTGSISIKVCLKYHPIHRLALKHFNESLHIFLG